jgi:hypothetical protein
MGVIGSMDGGTGASRRCVCALVCVVCVRARLSFRFERSEREGGERSAARRRRRGNRSKPKGYRSRPCTRAPISDTHSHNTINTHLSPETATGAQNLFPQRARVRARASVSTPSSSSRERWSPSLSLSLARTHARTHARTRHTCSIPSVAAMATPLIITYFGPPGE